MKKIGAVLVYSLSFNLADLICPRSNLPLLDICGKALWRSKKLIKFYLFIEYFQLLVVYGSLSSLGGDVDDDADMTTVLVQAHFITVDVLGSELVDGRSLGRVFGIAGCLR